MSFDEYEKSDSGGRPIELYQIQNGQNIWRLTSGDEDYEFQSTIWRKDDIHRTRIIQSQQGIKNRLTLTVPRDFAPAQLFKQGIPLYSTPIAITRLHRDDPAQEGVIWWTGRVFTVTWPLGKGDVKMIFEPGVGSLKSESLRGRWQIRCNHTIYDEFCQLSFVPNASSFIVTGMTSDGLTLTLPGLGVATPSSDYWQGGLLRLGTDQFNMITETSGDVMKIWRYMPDLTLGSTILVAPGCRNLKTNCINRFDNYSNYLGAPDVPLKDIFQGDGLKGTV